MNHDIRKPKEKAVAGAFPRFRQYRHAVSLSGLTEMEFVPASEEGDELGVLWLRPRENYPFYLRECRYTYTHRRSVNRWMPSRHSTGPLRSHCGDFDPGTFLPVGDYIW
jgi:hypothetical protein